MSKYFMYTMLFFLVVMLWVLIFSVILASTFLLTIGVICGASAVTFGITGLIVQDIWS